MSEAARGPDLFELHSLFGPEFNVPDHEWVAAADLSEPYRSLLAHERHMTETVEAYFGSLVDVVVLDRRRDGDSYARKILLRLQSDGRIVQGGIVRIHLQYCSSAVRQAIQEEKTPLGRILVDHDVLRRIEPTAFFRVLPGADHAAWFAPRLTMATFGRLGIIHCDEQPAIELMEVLLPVA